MLSAERRKLALPLTTTAVFNLFGLRSRFTAYQILTDTQHLLRDRGAIVDVDVADIGTGTAIDGFEDIDIITLMKTLRASNALVESHGSLWCVKSDTPGDRRGMRRGAEDLKIFFFIFVRLHAWGALAPRLETRPPD